MYVNGLYQYSFNIKGILRDAIPMTTQWKDFSSVLLSVESLKSFYAEYVFNQSAIILNPHPRTYFEWNLICSTHQNNHSSSQAGAFSSVDSNSIPITCCAQSNSPKGCQFRAEISGYSPPSSIQ